MIRGVSIVKLYARAGGAVRFFSALTFGSVLFLSVIAHANAEDDVWGMLQKAAVAARVLSYQGIFVCQTGQQAKAVEITHHFNGKDEFARNVILDGPPREMLNQGGDVVIYNPKNEKVVIEKRRARNMFPAVLPLNLDAVKENYTLRIVGTERIAARQAQILLLEPKDGLRYSYKFWVDAEYGLLLKSVMVNNRDEIMESIAFNQLSLFNNPSLDWFKPTIDHKKDYVMEDERVITSGDDAPASWVIKDLPVGYRKIEQKVRMVPGKPYPVTHMIFSDGMASVSLFIEPIPKGARTRVSLTTKGNTSFYANVNSGHLITVVGEVPEATIVQIANAVVFKK